MLCNFILLFPHDILLLLVMLLLGYIGLRFCSHLLLRTAGGGYSPNGAVSTQVIVGRFRVDLARGLHSF